MIEKPMGALVLGLGNLLLCDDGVGVHAIRRLQSDPRVPPEAVLMDGGTQGLSLLPHISGFRRLLVMDAVDVGEEPGALIRLEGPALDNLPGKPSVHQLGFADLVVSLKLLGESPEKIVVLGMQPQSSQWSTELSHTVQDRLDRLVDAAVVQLKIWATRN